MRLAEPRLTRHLAQRQRLIQIGVDVFLGLGDSRRLAALLNDTQRICM